MIWEKIFYEYKPYLGLLLADRAQMHFDHIAAQITALAVALFAIYIVWQRYDYRVLRRKVTANHKTSRQFKREQIRYYRKKYSRRL